MSLLAPVMWQVLAQSQEPRRRQLDWLTALEERAHDARSQIGQSNKRGEAALSDSEAFGHGLDAIVLSKQQLFLDRECFGDHGGEACVDFSLGAILDDEALPLAGASQLRLDRHDDMIRQVDRRRSVHRAGVRRNWVRALFKFSRFFLRPTRGTRVAFRNSASRTSISQWACSPPASSD